jgi:threonine/homoserine/homoserine lactone efflux protein
VIAFLTIAVLLIVAPGPDFALTVRNAVARGRRAGVSTALGVVSGQAAWSVAAGAGLTAVLVASHQAFVALRFAGSAYLVYLGVHMLVRGVRGPRAPARAAAPGGSPYVQGLLSNLANPKMAVFFTSLLPQFGGSVTALAEHSAEFAGLTLLWLAVVARASSLLRVEPVRRAIDVVSGLVLIGFGTQLAASRR